MKSLPRVGWYLFNLIRAAATSVRDSNYHLLQTKPCAQDLFVGEGWNGSRTKIVSAPACHYFTVLLLISATVFITGSRRKAMRSSTLSISIFVSS